jgi:hypothetical protein
MKHRYLVFLLIVFFSSPAIAQDSSSRHTYFPAEQLHLHFDKETYRPGEIAWFKVYLAEGQNNTPGLTIFTELLETDGTRIDSFVSPLTSGTASGQFILPGSSNVKELIVRSFTRSMAVAQRSFTKRIWIVPENYIATTPVKGELSLTLFPEGRSFITNVTNRLAFKAAFADGSPWPIKAAVKNEQEELIDSIWTTHYGMGSFLFSPAENVRYYIDWEDDQKRKKRTVLPASTANGISLQVRQRKGEILFELRKPAIPAVAGLHYITVTSRQQVVYEATVKSLKETVTGTIPTSAIANGVAWIDVYNENKDLLVQRPVFIDHKDLYFNTRIGTPKEDTSGSKLIELEIDDTAMATLSVSVVEIDTDQQSEQNIFSDLLFDGLQDIYNPAQYFKPGSDNNGELLDLVMLTTRWTTRSSNRTTVAGMNEEKFLGYTGTIRDDSNVPIAGVPLAVILQSKDASSEVFTDISGQDGSFRREGLLFGDSAQLFFTVTKSKAKKTHIDIRPTHNLRFPDLAFTPLPASSKKFIWDSKVAVIKTPVNTQIFTDTFEKSSIMLEEVKLTARFDSLQRMDEKHASPGLRGLLGGRIYDYMHDPIASRSPNVIRHIFLWMLPREVERKCFAIYLDERIIPSTEFARLRTLRSAEIAYVKYAPFDPQSMCAGIYIYTKNDEDYEKENAGKIDGRLSRLKIQGYSPVLEFSAPENDPAKTIDPAMPDHSSTLFWKPDIVLDRENPKAVIRILPSRSSKKLLVIVEGMNENGQYTYAEQVF